MPEDVSLIVDDFGLLDPGTWARGPKLSKEINQKVRLADLVSDRTGTIPFLISADMLLSDEAIVAVVAHEMHELEALREDLVAGVMSVGDFIQHCAPGIRRNLHEEAWDIADAAVERMRKRPS